MKNELLNYREKQKILYIEQRSDDELIAYGDMCRKANRIFDALEFYQKAKHRTGLEEIMGMAVSTGDTMLFAQTARDLGREPSGEEWNRLGRQTFALKKYTFARYAFEKGGNGAMLGEIKKITAEGNRKVE